MTHASRRGGRDMSRQARLTRFNVGRHPPAVGSRDEPARKARATACPFGSCGHSPAGESGRVAAVPLLDRDGGAVALEEGAVAAEEAPLHVEADAVEERAPRAVSK